MVYLYLLYYLLLLLLLSEHLYSALSLKITNALHAHCTVSVCSKQKTFETTLKRVQGQRLVSQKCRKTVPCRNRQDMAETLQLQTE